MMIQKTQNTDVNLLTGVIIKSISGFYFVEAADCVYECKAKGAFRKENFSPLVGDRVVIETQGNKGTVIKIEPRKNSLQRPPVANLDKLYIVASADEPKPNFYVIDKLTAFAVYHDIEPIIVFSKCDLADTKSYEDTYRKAGFKTLSCSSQTGEGFTELCDMLSGSTGCFTGNSGVGKSSILNRIMPELALETNEISKKLGRGKHTTRCVSLYAFNNGYIADTPGFSSLEFEDSKEKILKEDLCLCFPEFARYSENCRFSLSCSHTTDKGCAVVQAVKDGFIPTQRHESYRRMYEEVKSLNKWD